MRILGQRGTPEKASQRNQAFSRPQQSSDYLIFTITPGLPGVFRALLPN
jgi:hypothetical protein